MRKFRVPSDRRQQSLLPRSIEEFVPEDDLARYVDSLVEELDLSGIEEWYSEIGRKGFSPEVMVKLLVYGQIRGIRSSRSLSRACEENIKFMYVTSGEKPDFRTISLFRKRFCKELADILRQTIVIGLESEVIDLKHVAIDGSLIKSFAGDNSYKTPEKIAKELEALERLIEQDIERDDCSDDDENDGISGSLPKAWQNPEQRKAKLQKALEKHQEYKLERKIYAPKQVSITDPDCRYTRRGPAYNGQAAVDERSRMVVAGYVTSAVTDSAELTPILQEIESNTGANPTSLTADAGYTAFEGLVELARRNIEGYIPLREPSSKGYPPSKFQYDAHADNFLCPNGKTLKLKNRGKEFLLYRAKREDCEKCSLRVKCQGLPIPKSAKSLQVSKSADLVHQMNERTRSQEGKKMAVRRSATVETVFAHLKYARKLRRFLYRGMNMINAIWKFELAVYNLERIIHFKRQGIMKTATA
jgi:transposase